MLSVERCKSPHNMPTLTTIHRRWALKLHTSNQEKTIWHFLPTLLLQETWNPEQNFTGRLCTLRCAMKTYILVHELYGEELTISTVAFSYCLCTKFIFKWRNTNIISEEFRESGILKCTAVNSTCMCMCTYIPTYIYMHTYIYIERIWYQAVNRTDL